MEKKKKEEFVIKDGRINIAADDLAYATEEEIKELEDFLRKHNTTGKGIQKVN